MSGMWHKTLVYLGLAEEPEGHYEPEPSRADVTWHEPGEASATDGGTDADQATSSVSKVRPLRARGQPEDTRVMIVRAADFDDAEEVGKRYRAGQLVLLDLGDVDARTGRRLLDFVSGTIFALRGEVQPAGERAFLLVPEAATVPAHERQRLSELGYVISSGSTAGI